MLTLCESLHRNEYSPHVCSLEPLRGRDQPVIDRLAELKVPLHSANKRHRWDPFARHQVRRLVRKIEPVAIHAWGSEAARYAPANYEAAKVVTLGRFRQAGFVARDSTATVILPSEGLRLQAIDSGFTPERLKVVQPGVALRSEAVSAETRKQFLTQFDLPEAARVMAIVARQVPRKGLQELLWAADLVRVLEDDMRLLVIGEGPQGPALERFARMASDLEHIRFLGTRHDVEAILPHCEMLWHAGDETSVPIAILEAMAAGIPVVADATPGARQAISEAQTGLLVPPRDRAARGRATQRLLEDAGLRTRLGKAARERVAEEFSAERMTADYAQCYREATGAVERALLPVG